MEGHRNAMQAAIDSYEVSYSVQTQEGDLNMSCVNQLRDRVSQCHLNVLLTVSSQTSYF